MARPPRLEHPGAVWHATSRGRAGEPVFLDDLDRAKFLQGVARVGDAMRWRLHAYVVMNDHYHLVVETPEPNLSIGMRQVNGLYGPFFNRRHGRTGQVFQGRFQGILVERGAILLDVCRHVVLNPVRAGLAPTADAWPWSSYAYTAGTSPPPPWLETAWTLSQFDGKGARARYRAFVKDGEGKQHTPWSNLKGQVFLGGEGFRARAERAAQAAQAAHEALPIPSRPTLSALLQAVCAEYDLDPEALRKTHLTEPRALLAWLARHDAAARLAPIAEALGRDISRISQLALAGEKLEREDKRIAKRAAAIRSRLIVNLGVSPQS